MPQIAQLSEVFASQLFWLLILFGAMFIVVGLGMLPKIQATVDARDARIAADLAAAEQARGEADGLEEQYRVAMDKSRAEALALSGAAKAKAAKAIEKSVAKGDKDIASRLDKAGAAIGAARDQAMAEIEAVAADAAQLMVERVAGLKVSPAAARGAVAKELAHG